MFSSPRILIVDDNLDSSDMTSLMLRQADQNYQITVAQTAEKALSLIDNQSFDLYILDYWLPKMTGFQLCNWIRKKDLKTPVIFFSAMARPSDRDGGQVAGANEYLVKPNDLTKLPEAVSRLLSRRSFSAKAQWTAYSKDRLW